MLRQRNTILACVVEYAKDSRITVFLPSPTPATQVVVLGALTRPLSVYPFLDLPRQLRQLGLDPWTATTYADGLSQGWCLLCIDGPRAESKPRGTPPYPLRHRTTIASSGRPSFPRFDA